MEIYVQVISEDDGSSAWWNHEKNESYLMDGKDLWCHDSPYGDYCRGTPFSTAKKARKAAREAINLASYDGMVDPKARFWRYANGKLVLTKFTRDGKIKRS